MSKELKIRLLVSKSNIYRAGFLKATAEGDTASAKKWKAGYHAIKDEIAALKED